MSLFDYLIADDARGAEYIVRRAPPAWVARLVMDEAEEYDPSGITLSIDAEQTLCEFVWLDDKPTAAQLRKEIPVIREFLAHVYEVDKRRIDAQADE